MTFPELETGKGGRLQIELESVMKSVELLGGSTDNAGHRRSFRLP